MRRCFTLPALCAALVASTGCSGAAAGGRAPGYPLPPYTDRDVAVFDDAIDPRAVGYELERAINPNGDALLRERAQLSDAALRARVTTVSSKNEDRGLSWEIGFRTVEKLAGPGPIGDEFTVDVGPHSSSAGILRAWDGRLIGKSFVVFVRAFARADSPGDADLHFHVAPDTKDEAAAVRAAVTEPVR